MQRKDSSLCPTSEPPKTELYDLFPEGSSVNESYQNILGWEEVYSGLKPIIIRSHNSMAVTFHIGKLVAFISSKDY